MNHSWNSCFDQPPLGGSLSVLTLICGFQSMNAEQQYQYIRGTWSEVKILRTFLRPTKLRTLVSDLINISDDPNACYRTRALHRCELCYYCICAPSSCLLKRLSERWVKERAEDRSSNCCFTPQIAAVARVGLRTWNSIQVSHIAGRDPLTSAMSFCLLGQLSRELDHKWSSWRPIWDASTDIPQYQPLYLLLIIQTGDLCFL